MRSTSMGLPLEMVDEYASRASGVMIDTFLYRERSPETCRLSSLLVGYVDILLSSDELCHKTLTGQPCTPRVAPLRIAISESRASGGHVGVFRRPRWSSPLAFSCANARRTTSEADSAGPSSTAEAATRLAQRYCSSVRYTVTRR